MIINCINIKRRPDRKISLIHHLEEMEVMYRFWDGYDDRKVMPFENITASHQMIVRDAKNRNLECVIIAEDDLRFSSKNSPDYFIKNVPDNYSIYFGMIYTGTIQDRRIVHGFSGLQLYCVHRSFYDVFLSAPLKKHLDSWIGERCHLYNFMVCEPFIAYGESGYSNNFQREWVFQESKLPRKLLKDDL